MCCRRPSFPVYLDGAAFAQYPAADPAARTAPAAPAAAPASAPAPTPAGDRSPDTSADPESEQLPLDHLAEIFSGFSPPPRRATAPPPAASSDTAGASDDHGHYLEGVLLASRPKRDLPPPPPQGRVIYPSQIAAERLREVRRVASAAGDAEGDAPETAFRNTLGGRLRPAGALGTVKLGGLTPPPPPPSRGPSGKPNVTRELPILPPLPSSPPPQSSLGGDPDYPLGSDPGPSPLGVDPDSIPLPAFAPDGGSLPAEPLAVTPRTVSGLKDVDIRPLRVEMWRGQAPQAPAGRAAAGHADRDSADSADSDSDSGRQPGSLLSRILDSLQGGPDSRHGNQDGQEATRGRFFGAPPPLPLHRPTPPPHRGPRPPFHRPEQHGPGGGPHREPPHPDQIQHPVHTQQHAPPQHQQVR